VSRTTILHADLERVIVRISRMTNGAIKRFSDLPLVASEDDARRIHRTTGVYFVKRGGLAHAAMDCGHLDWTDLVDNPSWRVATDAECRALGIAWCSDCA
jgi:hypothetical protein